jgi:hypothetical protein
MCSSFGPARYPHDWRCWRNLQTQTCNGGADAHIAVWKRIRWLFWWISLIHHLDHFAPVLYQALQQGIVQWQATVGGRDGKEDFPWAMSSACKSRLKTWSECLTTSEVR